MLEELWLSPCYQEGETFSLSKFQVSSTLQSMESVKKCLGDAITLTKDGYGLDNNYGDIIYLPEDADVDLPEQEARWKTNGLKNHYEFFLAKPTFSQAAIKFT